MSEFPVIAPQKLIEVALPLNAINKAAVRESYIYRGNPSALHKWWAQRPLAAARAVIFAQLVNDPEGLWRCQNPGKEPIPQNKTAWTKARTRLFGIIERLVEWENTTNEVVLNEAREEIRKSWKDACALNKDHPRAKELFDPEKMPGLHDPFAGGGTIPLEAQRLGLEAFASDLNPVAVLINKAMIEIPPKFAARPPVNPESRKESSLIEKEWKGAQGLAEDVRYYGAWMREEAKKRIGHLYPPVEITKEMAEERPDLKPYVGEKLPVIAWLWARTVKSPNPAFAHVDVPLASTFVLSSKEKKEVYVYVHPIINGDTYHFAVKVGKPPAAAKTGTTAGKRAAFRCLMSSVPVDYQHIRTQAKKPEGLGQKLMALVVEGTRGRVYISPTLEAETIAAQAQSGWKPDVEFFPQALGFRVGNYGMSTWSDLFTSRQLTALTTFSDLLPEARAKIRQDAIAAGMADDSRGLASGGAGATSYSEATSVYLAFGIDKTAEYGCTLVPWYAQEDRPKGLFARQAVQMVWDFAEVNPFATIGGTFEASVTIVAGALGGCHAMGSSAKALQHDALSWERQGINPVISTDPPYYDNIGYADLSDFFYVWLRPSLRSVYPDELSTIAVPKAEELVATPARHGGKDKAEAFFLDGMTQAMHRLAEQSHPAFPVTIYYAFKQSETDTNESTASTGWETFLDAVMRAGFAIHGTWPMRTERGARSRGIGSNALASSIILVCRPRTKNATTISRRAFIRELNAALPLALDAMTRQSEDLPSPVAPVDLSQAIIGPGMAIFSKYSAVLEADGKPMTVRTALQLINRFLAEDDFDPDTQFCLRWFEQHGWDEGQFGEADTLARAKGTAVSGVADAGVIESGGGAVRLLKWSEYPTDWTPETDKRLPVWELLHHLIRLQRTATESDAGRVLAACSGKAEPARQLAYRLYTLCERAKWAEDARAYNEIVTGWSAIEAAAPSLPPPKTGKIQGTLFDVDGVE